MIKRGRFYLRGLLALIFIIAGLSLGLLWWNSDQAKPRNQPEAPVVIEAPKVCPKKSPLDGTCLPSEAQGFFAVMIDNYPMARPAAGLSQARLVYEAMAEAPITRFLAVFSLNDEINKIGPVRSARPYYVDWAKEFSAPYLHVGGSPEALQQLKSYGGDLNEFFNGQYFWRDSALFAPYNVFTSTEQMRHAVTNKTWSLKTDFDSWSFKEEANLEQRPSAQTIKVDWASPAFLVEWKYNRESNDYERYEAGILYKDAEGNAVRAKNIVVMYVESRVLDNVGRRQTQTLGQGQAVVFHDGQAQEARWKRIALGDRTRFYKADGLEEISFNPGTTWIEAVPTHFPKVIY